MMLSEGAKYKNINNKYVLSLAGVSISNPQGDQPMLLYPYAANGNLKLFLKQIRENHQVFINFF